MAKWVQEERIVPSAGERWVWALLLRLCDAEAPILLTAQENTGRTPRACAGG